MGDDGQKRISDLASFLIVAGVLGTFNWVRNGPAAGIAAMVGIGVVVLIGRALRARTAK